MAAATAKAMGIEAVLTAPHAPWQNAFVERFIGSARRECLGHVIVSNEKIGSSGWIRSSNPPVNRSDPGVPPRATDDDEDGDLQ